LDEKGRPNVVDRASIYPPQSQLPPLTSAERDSIIKQSSIFGHYEKVVDRESAYEMLKARAPQAEKTTAPPGKTWQSEVTGTLSALGKSAARAMGTQVGREIMRGVLGSIFGTATTRRTRR
jgi:DNA helicase HerA-like ATPase